MAAQMLAKYNKAQDMKNIRTALYNFSRPLLKSAAHIGAATVVAVVLALMPSCDHSDLWDELPSEITEFINQYFPDSELQAVSHTASGYHVRIDDGPGMTFGTDLQWLAVDGYGMPLPQVLLFDKLPPVVYDYIQGTAQLDEVFSISRDHGKYTIALLDTDLYYDTATGQLTGNT